MSKLQPVRGTHDLFGEDMRRQQYIIDTAARISERFGFEPIATPVFEFQSVFSRTLGETADIVNKEMYSFEDRGGELLTLRPEGTAPIARAYLSNGLMQNAPLKLFYNGPMFRYERPQKGRTRQFHQLGVELIGVDKTQADIEVLSMASLLLKELGLENRSSLHINSIGDNASRAAYRNELVAFLQDKKDKLSEESQVRLQANPLRILDSKDKGDKQILLEAPLLTDFLNEESKTIFETICSSLEQLNIAYKVDPKLVRGLDYYRHSVFEFKSDELGAQDTILAGGRYDGLIEQMGGTATPAVGWAAGIERLALLVKATTSAPKPVALIPLGEEADSAVNNIAHQLRSEGLAVHVSYGGNLSKRMKKANKAGAYASVIIGSDELQNGEATVKNLETGAQVQMRLDQLAEQLKNYVLD